MAFVAALLLHGAAVVLLPRALPTAKTNIAKDAPKEVKDETVQVAFVPDETTPDEPRPATRHHERKPAPTQPPEPPPKPAVVQQPPPPPPQPPPPDTRHLKMVDQDRFPDEKDNPDAKYLAEKNHRAQRDTRTRETNLVKDQPKPTPPATERSQNTQPEPGMKDHKIAELEKHAGEEHQIVRQTPARSGEAGESKSSRPGKLSMRGLQPSGDAKPEPGDGLARPFQPGTPGRSGPTDEAQRGARMQGARRPNLALGPLDYDKVVGESVAAEERQRAARAEPSHAEGRWERQQKKLAAFRSSIENFTPEAYVGREAELGTRANPFAAYIAKMHRGIHKLWAFGFLASLDGKGAFDPYNDMERWTEIAIVIDGDGKIEKATISRPSGYLPFDAAALDVVMSLSPLPKPPEAIKSYDGKVYLDWRFHRDGRQCGTEGVTPHILTEDKHAAAARPKL